MIIYTKYIKKHFPTSWQVKLNDLKEAVRPIRTNKTVTKILGPQYKRSRKFIELDITYDCNLKCLDCNRSCRQAPSKQQMSTAQIKKFVAESIENNIKWERIALLGGEPTLHPDIFKIIKILLDYKNSFSPKTLIRVATNGCGKKVNSILAKIPKDVEILNTFKKNIAPVDFYRFNFIPTELKACKNADYSNACETASFCGLGLTPYGYYACAVAGGIDRIFGFNKGRKHLPSPKDSMFDQLNLFCKLCGHFKKNKKAQPGEMSPVWQKAYINYQKKKPVLTFY